MEIGCDESRNMRDIRQKIGIDGISNFLPLGEIKPTRISARTDNYQLWAVFLCQGRDTVHIYSFGLTINAIRNNAIISAGEVLRQPMTEMAAVIKFHRQDGISRL